MLRLIVYQQGTKHSLNTFHGEVGGTGRDKEDEYLFTLVSLKLNFFKDKICLMPESNNALNKLFG